MSFRPCVELIHASSASHLASIAELFQEYADSLSIDLSFQDFAHELANLPGVYAAPRGCLLLALADGQVAGCCALRPIDEVDEPNASEMKRLYVRPAFRRFGLGRMLVEATLDAGRRLGYAAILLDTLDEMEAARTLYEDLGFEEVAPYYHNPIAGAHYLRVML
jgi:putative acetyltransferase